MFKKSLAAMSIMLSGVGSMIPLHAKPAQDIMPILSSMPHSSHGKSSRTTSKPSGAAALKRAAKKRNNIRKHN